MAIDDDDSDRDAILARRALLLSTALAAFSCGAPENPDRGSSTSTSVAPTTTTIATGASSASATASEQPKAMPAPLSPWKEVLAAAPARGKPPGVSGAEDERLGYLEQQLDREYGAVQALWEHPPACDANAPECKATWREVGEKLKAIYDATRVWGFGSCGGASGGTGSVAARSRAHSEYVKSLVGRLEAHLDAIAAAFSPQGEQVYRKIQANASEPPPMPCLSPCAMPEVNELSQSISFAPDSSAIDAAPSSKSALDLVVSMYKSNRKPSNIVVRGHADPREKNPKELATARAKAAAEWLVKAGIPRGNVLTKSFGVDYPIASGATADAADRNRRVDFEAVPAK